MLKQTFVILFLALMRLSPILQLQAEICETHEIETVLNEVNQDCLVLFNISSTLYESSTIFSDRQWREYFAKRVQQIVPDPTVSQKLINRVKNKIVREVPKKLVEEITPELISSLQQEKIPVFAITEKRMTTPYADNFGWITSQHLLNLGINFEATYSYFNALEDRNDKYSFAYGILFTNKKNVGPALISFLETNQYQPSRIIMIDNSQKSLEIVEAALSTTNIAFTGWRYSRTDSHRDTFYPVLGIIEFIAFINENKILSDEEAIQYYSVHSEIDYEAWLDDLIRKLAVE